MAGPSQGAIFPARAASLKSLTVTLIVMAYLACLALGALILVNSAVANWTRGLAGEATVQVRPLSTADLATELSRAQEILHNTRGITSVQLLDREVGIAMLRPWLGDQGLDDLPIPRLIRFTIDQTAPPDFAGLGVMLADKVKGVSLDTHQRWQSQLSRTGNLLSRVAVLVLALIAMATVTTVSFAARAVLESNRDTVEVLELVGAETGFIAGAIDQRFFFSGFLSGLLGVIFGVMTFVMLSFFSVLPGDATGGLLQGLFMGDWRSVWIVGAGVVVIPVAGALLCVLAARFTLSGILRAAA